MRRVIVTVLSALTVLAFGGRARAHEGHDGPHPSATAPAVAASPAPIVFRVRPGARADLGWTGISHDQEWPADQLLGFALECGGADGTCKAVGGHDGDFFGAPIPLSSGGVPACVVNRLTRAVAGTLVPKTGCGDLELHLASAVFLGETVDRPCPVCTGDTTANDGRREGHCEGGAGAGVPCDAQGTSTRYGATSTDCLPSPGKAAGTIAIDLTPLTTGDARLHASTACLLASGTEAARCACAGETQANGCVGGTCTTDGRCDDGPVDGACSRAPFRGCRPGSGTQDCESSFAGSGECVVAARRCFGETLGATGHCDPKTPTYVATFCTPQTNASALNATTGLPGPSRLVLPLERIR